MWGAQRHFFSDSSQEVILKEVYIALLSLHCATVGNPGHWLLTRKMPAFPGIIWKQMSFMSYTMLYRSKSPQQCCIKKSKLIFSLEHFHMWRPRKWGKWNKEKKLWFLVDSSSPPIKYFEKNYTSYKSVSSLHLSPWPPLSCAHTHIACAPLFTPVAQLKRRNLGSTRTQIYLNQAVLSPHV